MIAFLLLSECRVCCWQSPVLLPQQGTDLLGVFDWMEAASLLIILEMLTPTSPLTLRSSPPGYLCLTPCTRSVPKTGAGGGPLPAAWVREQGWQKATCCRFSLLHKLVRQLQEMTELVHSKQSPQSHLIKLAVSLGQEQTHVATQYAKVQPSSTGSSWLQIQLKPAAVFIPCHHGPSTSKPSSISAIFPITLPYPLPGSVNLPRYWLFPKLRFLPACPSIANPL